MGNSSNVLKLSYPINYLYEQHLADLRKTDDPQLSDAWVVEQKLGTKELIEFAQAVADP